MHVSRQIELSQSSFDAIFIYHIARTNIMSMRKITETDSICKKINLLLLKRKEIFETEGDFLKIKDLK